MREIQVGRIDGARVAAVVVDGRPTDLVAERPDDPSWIGAVLLGRIVGRHAASGGAFVEIGAPEPGFLRKGRGQTGEMVVVQVTDDARAGKGCDLTADIALPGRGLVHRPVGKGITVSRQLGPAGGDAIRGRLAGRRGGWIVRRAGASMAAEALAAEADRLADLGSAIAGRARDAVPAAILLPAPTAVQRLILDTPDISAVVCEDAAEARALAGWARAVAPDLAGTVASGPAPVLEDVPALLAPRQGLPGGGAMLVARTPALTAIDVDSGADGDPVRVDREAAAAVARALRLRNLGGTVAVDFLTAGEPAGLKAVRAALLAAVADDPQPVEIARQAPFGVVLLTRRRRGRPVDLVLGL